MKEKESEMLQAVGALALGLIGALFGDVDIPTVKPKPTTRRVSSFASRSTPGKLYEVRVNEKDQLTCDCPGFFYRNDCRHVQQVMRVIPFMSIAPRPEPVAQEAEKPNVPVPPAKMDARDESYVSVTFNGGRPVLKLANVRSMKSNNLYTIYSIDNGQVACTCNGYFYRGTCRHADNYLARSKGTFVA